MDNSRILKKLLHGKFRWRRSVAWPRWEDIRRDSLLLLSTRELRTPAGDGDFWGQNVEEVRVWCGLLHQWWRKLSVCILRTFSQNTRWEWLTFNLQYKLQPRFLLMTVDLNTKLTTVLNTGNSVLRLKTWYHWNWILMGENVELSNINWGIHCIWHNST